MLVLVTNLDQTLTIEIYVVWYGFKKEVPKRHVFEEIGLYTQNMITL